MIKDNKKYIHLGSSRKPHGIKGGFRFQLFNTEDSCLAKDTIVLLTPLDSSSSVESSGEFFSISSIAFGNNVITYLKGVSDRNDVEAMIPYDIYIAEDDLPKTGDDEYYMRDLVGCFAFEDGKQVGEVIDFYETPVQTVLIIKTKNNKFEVPMVEQFVFDVDIDNKKIEVKLPDLID